MPRTMSDGLIPWNLIESARGRTDREVLEELVRGDAFRVVRITSFGQQTPTGEWYDQDEAEWVILLTGSAGLRFEGDDRDTLLSPGDVLHIPAHRRHRVSWTEAGVETIWLAIHYLPDPHAT